MIMSSHNTSTFVIALLAVLPLANGLIQQYAEMGVCENVVTKETRCAMQAPDCEPSHIDGLLNVAGEVYRSAHHQKLNGKDPCDCGQTEISACMNGDSFTCIPTNSGYCSSFSSSFGKLPTEKGYCMCDSHSVDNVTTRTKYGACQDLLSSNNHFCAYSPRDCEDNHIWVQPERAKDIVGTDCFCENVRTGGCIGGFTSFICATTEDECDFDTYYPPHSLKELHGQTCNLCKGPVEIIDELTDLEKKKSGLSPGAIAGITISCIAAATTAAALAFFGIKKFNYGSKQPHPPVEVSEKSDSSNQMI